MRDARYLKTLVDKLRETDDSQERTNLERKIKTQISIVTKIDSNKLSQEFLKNLIETSYKNLKEANAEQQDIHLTGEEATNSTKNSCEVM